MTRNEKRLLTIMLSVALVGGLVVLADYYFDNRDALRAERNNLENEWITIQTLFEDRQKWNSRSTWLEVNQPEFENSEEIDQEIYNEALARDAEGVRTSNQTLLPTVTEQDYTQAGVSLIAEGTLRDVFRWLHELNRPEDFRVIRNLRVSPSKENDDEIVCQFELLRWYKNKS